MSSFPLSLKSTYIPYTPKMNFKGCITILSSVVAGSHDQPLSTALVCNRDVEDYSTYQIHMHSAGEYAYKSMFLVMFPKILLIPTSANTKFQYRKISQQGATHPPLFTSILLFWLPYTLNFGIT